MPDLRAQKAISSVCVTVQALVYVATILCLDEYHIPSMSGVLELFSLQGRTALITGATRGIGQALAIALAEAGADVVLVQRDESNQATREAVEKLGRKASIVTADLASASDVAGLTKRVLDAGHDIDILVNCGGIQRRHP